VVVAVCLSDHDLIFGGARAENGGAHWSTWHNSGTLMARFTGNALASW